MKSRRSVAVVVVLAMAVGGAGLTASSPAGSVAQGRGGPGVGEAATRAEAENPTDKTEAAKDLAKPPLRFEANQGQTDPEVRFVARSGGLTAFLTQSEAVFSLAPPRRAPDPAASGAGEDPPPPQAGPPHVVRMGLQGANPSPEVVAEGQLPGVSNYFIGNDPAKWRTGVPGFAQVRYRGVYPGIDQVFHAKGGVLEYDFEVAPGVDPGMVSLSFEGAEGLSVDDKGDLVVGTPAGQLRQKKPVVYQSRGQARQAVDGQFRIQGHRVGFALGAYDKAKPLVIDPSVDYSTYLGGSENDDASGIAVDAAGHAYVTGSTASLNFPTKNARQPANSPPCDGCTDAFVTKLATRGPPASQLIYSTYLGGATTGGAFYTSASDTGTAIDVDGQGGVWITGFTSSADFPTTDNAYDRSSPGNTNGANFNAFVAKLNPALSGAASLVYSTYLEGSEGDQGNAIAVGPPVDANGPATAYVAGTTSSAEFPTTAGAFRRARTGGDAFVAKIDPDASGDASLVYSTYLGGGGSDGANGIAVDAGGDAYLTGDTGSGDFPAGTTAGYQTARASTGRDDRDAFVAKLRPDPDDPAGEGDPNDLLYSTYLGGAARPPGLDPAFKVRSQGNGIAVGASGVAVVTGQTNATNFPRRGAIQPTYGGGTGADAFVAKINPGLSGSSSLLYSTYLGASGRADKGENDVGTGVGLDPAGNAYVVGTTSAVDFPTKGTFQPHGGEKDAFVTKLTATGSSLVYSTFYGGSRDDEGQGIAVGQSGEHAGFAYIAGTTGSNDIITKNAFDPASGCTSGDSFTCEDAFVAKISPVDVPAVLKLEPRSAPPSGGTPVVITGSAFTHDTRVVFKAPFREMPAQSVRVESPTRITAVAPAHPDPQVGGVVDVTVTRPGPEGTSYAHSMSKFVFGWGSWATTGDPPQSLPTAELPPEHTTTALPNGKVLVTGIHHEDPRTLLYDPGTGKWAFTKRGMNRPRLRATATLLGGPNCAHDHCGKVLVVGGQTGGTVSDTAELYDPATETWTLLTGDEPGEKLHEARQHHTATLLADGKVLVVGGTGATVTEPADRSYLRSSEVFDPAATTSKGRWTSTPGGGLAGPPRRFHTATLLPDRRVLVTGGQVPTPADDRGFGADAIPLAELYDPVTRTWRSTRSMGTARMGHTATLLTSGPDAGRVLVAGGSDQGYNDATRAVEIYNPAGEGSWRLATVLRAARRAHTASVLANGKILFAGGNTGVQPAEPAVASAELYDPATGARTWAATMLTPRRSHSAAVLPDGRVLAVGGQAPGNNAPAPPAEVFDPTMWLDWASLGGDLTSGPDVSSWASNRLDVFVRGPGNGLWHKWRDGSSWSNWEWLGGTLTSDPGAVSWGPNRVDIFVRGTDNALWHKAWNGSFWESWEWLGGHLTSGPDVASWGPGRLDIFVRGPDNALWHKWWDGASWSHWEWLGGVLTSDPAAVSWGRDRVDIFVRGTDNAMWHKAWTGSSWSQWSWLGGHLTSGPDVASWGPGRLDTFVRGPDYALYRKSWTGSFWTDWEHLGGVLTSDPGAVSRATNRIDVFVRGTDTRLWHRAWGP